MTRPADKGTFREAVDRVTRPRTTCIRCGGPFGPLRLVVRIGLPQTPPDEGQTVLEICLSCGQGLSAYLGGHKLRSDNYSRDHVYIQMGPKPV